MQCPAVKRVRETELCRPEGQRQGTVLAAVFPISDQRQPTGGKLHPDLMAASGEKLYVYQTQSVYERDPLEDQRGVAYTAALTGDDVGLVALDIMIEQILKTSGFRSFAFDDGEITLVHLPGRYRRRQRCRSLLCPGIDHEPTRLAIETMNTVNLA